MPDNHSRILIVDDEPSNIAVLENIFEGEFVLKSVSSGKEALEAIEDFYPDIVLLDIMMPGLDGYEVCQRLRDREETRFTKIIFVSAKEKTEDRLKGYGTGADDYITKPFDADEIAAKVRIFLKLKYVEEVDEIKNEFLNMFVKEKKTPLREILGFASLLKKSVLPSFADQVSVDEIIERGNHLWELSKKTKLLCELKHNKPLTQQHQEINSLIDMAVENAKARCKNKDISFHIPNGFKQEVFLDPSLFAKALAYVIENAIEHSQSGGEITVFCEEADERFSVKVKDQGQRIDNKNMRNIFNEFATSNDNAPERRGGINLTIARRIAWLHQGDFNISNNEHEGVTFEFSLPKTVERGSLTD